MSLFELAVIVGKVYILASFDIPCMETIIGNFDRLTLYTTIQPFTIWYTIPSDFVSFFCGLAWFIPLVVLQFQSVTSH